MRKPEITLKERETAHFYDRIPFRSVLRKGQGRLRFFDGIPCGSRVLDVGAGSGRTSALLRSLHPGCEIICLDISEVSLRRLGFPTRVNASALSLPFASGTFDFVTSVGCLHHTPDARTGFAECARVLKEGGGLVVALYNRWNSYPLIYAAAHLVPRPIRDRIHHPLIQDQLFTPHASFHSIAEVRGWFEEEAVRLVKVLSTGYTPPYFLLGLGQFVYYYGIKNG
jgi:SAM-dependent methyltransferase